MPTIKQKQALSKIVENGGNVSQAMMEVGYSPNTAKTPQKLTESIGFSELLSIYDLTEEFIIKALISDIQNKPGHRLGELALASEIMGLKRKGIIIANQFSFEQQKIEKPLTLNPSNPEVMKLMRKIDEILKEELRQV